MNLAISNIAWNSASEADVFEWMHQLGFSGLEIAPTKIFPIQPYDRLREAAVWAHRLEEEHGLAVPSMQSIWYGRQENIFTDETQRESLRLYTEKAIDFAASIGCSHLVFGCPRNRNIPQGATADSAVSFFRRISDYAYQKGCKVGMEANPSIYNTNYINTTADALKLISEVSHPAFKLNLDVGTMIYNEEPVSLLRGRVQDISHVHISEPYLAPIAERAIHRELLLLLQEERYQGWISIEMGTQENPNVIHEALNYLNRITR